MKKWMVIVVFLGFLLGISCRADAKPLKVFILAGQSNAQGHADVSTFNSMMADPETAAILKDMLHQDGTPHVCEKVWISSIGSAGEDAAGVPKEQIGKLTVGFGASSKKIGPELTLGIYLEKALNEPILIIKTAWGGRNIHTDFRPPSAGPRKINDFTLERWKERNLDIEEETAKAVKNVGVTYHQMMDHIKHVLEDIKRVVPDYDPKEGFELAGFVWFQGWNDHVDGWTYPNRSQPGGYDEYTKLLQMFIKDVRKDLAAPNMPFIIGVMGVDGKKGEERSDMKNFRAAQNAAAMLPEFKGNVAAVQTALYWADDLDELQQRWNKVYGMVTEENKKNPDLSQAEKDAAYEKAKAENFSLEEIEQMKGISNGGYHYLGASKIVAPIGKAFAEAVLSLQKDSTE